MLSMGFSEARAIRDEHLEEVFGTRSVTSAERGMLTVYLPETAAEAFKMVMSYIYTDRIHRKNGNYQLIIYQ